MTRWACLVGAAALSLVVAVQSRGQTAAPCETQLATTQVAVDVQRVRAERAEADVARVVVLMKQRETELAALKAPRPEPAEARK